MAGEIAHEMWMSPLQQGFVVAAYYACGALLSFPAGWLAERWGSGWVLRIGLAIASLVLCALATAVHTYPALIMTVLVSGAANSAIQLAWNARLSEVVPRKYQGLAYGIKQAAIPAASLCGGFAVPGIAQHVGWRWVFALAAVVAIAGLITDRTPGANIKPRSSGGVLKEPALVATALGSMCGTAAVTAMATFFTTGATTNGISAGTAGLMLGGASAAAVLSRLLVGGFTDRSRHARRGVIIVAILLVTGAAGALLLAAPTVIVFAGGTLLAFGAGWAWPGLLVFSVAQEFADNPGSATGLLETGGFIGCAVGPLLVGALATHATYTAAWSSIAALMVVGSLLLLFSDRLMRAKHRKATQ